MLAKLLGGGTIKAVGNVIDDMHFSGEEKEKLKLQFAEIESKLKEKQLDINKAEASHRSVFVAGWRPFIGWISASALAFNFILAPCLEWYIAFAKLDIVLPTISLNELYPIILGMLGLGFARSYEKKNNLTK
mgnify:FL=1|tara:strand:+ start:69 stop:464 length:396 start_codon:yes stop_codon:yes gene_type:complete